MTHAPSFRLQRAVLPSPAGRRWRNAPDEGPAAVPNLRLVWPSPGWSSVSRACRRASHLSLLAQRNVTQRKGPRTGRSCDETARLRELATGFAEGASLHLQRTGRIHSATPRAFLRQPASPKRDEGQRHAALCAALVRRFAADAIALDVPTLSCRRVLGGKAACGTRDGSRGLGCRRRDAPSTQPDRYSRTRSAQPNGRQARGASLGHVSVRAERWLGGRQPGETLNQFGGSRKERRGWRVKRLTSLANTATGVRKRRSARAQTREARV